MISCKRCSHLLGLIGFLVLASGLGMPTQAAVTTDSRLLQAFEAALKNKDKAALMALYHWEGVPAWIKENQSDEIDDLLTRDFQNANLAPLPTNFPTVFSNEVLRAHLNIQPTGWIQFGFTDGFGTEVIYGKVDNAYYLTSIIIEQSPATATNDLIVHVQSADGQALRHIFVNAGSPDRIPRLHFRKLYGGDFLTDDQGQMRVPVTEKGHYLVAANAHGFGLLSPLELTNHAVMTLQPWGRIEGVLKNRNCVLTNVAVELTSDRTYYSGSVTPPVAGLGERTITDEHGRFVFEYLPPMKLIIQPGDNQTAYGMLPCRVSVAPGETDQLEINGHGRPVMGRVIKDPSLATNLDLASCSITLRLITTGSNAPEKHVHFRVARDGTWCASFVEPGDYRLSGSIQTNDTGLAYLDPMVIHVPDIGSGAADVPWDVGVATLKPAATVGNPAPDFNITDLDGKSLRLSDYRGKYVLLDFWATWCGPCVAETPNLKATHDAFGNDARFAMISLSLDEDTSAPKRFARRHDITWTQGFLGDWLADPVTSTYGVHGIPAIFLIGPDGKILATQLRGTNILATVSANLPH
jgi:peroxiredoxin